MPPSSQPEQSEFALQTVKVSPAAGRTARTLPTKIAFKINQDRAELWPKGYDEDDDEPIERWALCNIISWGHNAIGLRIMVLRSSCSDRLRTTYDFKTTDGAVIVAILKRVTSGMASDLRNARAKNAPHHQPILLQTGTIRDGPFTLPVMLDKAGSSEMDRSLMGSFGNAQVVGPIGQWPVAEVVDKALSKHSCMAKAA